MDQTPVVGIPAAADPDRDRPVAELPAPPAAAAPPGLPSQRLVRLAELAAAAVDRADPSGPVLLTGQALADVLAAVDASTAPNTKRAYASDWARFTGWTTQRGFAALPAPPLVVAH